MPYVTFFSVSYISGGESMLKEVELIVVHSGDPD